MSLITQKRSTTFALLTALLFTIGLSAQAQEAKQNWNLVDWLKNKSKNEKTQRVNTYNKTKRTKSGFSKSSDKRKIAKPLFGNPFRRENSKVAPAKNTNVSKSKKVQRWKQQEKLSNSNVSKKNISLNRNKSRFDRGVRIEEKENEKTKNGGIRGFFSNINKKMTERNARRQAIIAKSREEKGLPASSFSAENSSSNRVLLASSKDIGEKKKRANNSSSKPAISKSPIPFQNAKKGKTAYVSSGGAKRYEFSLNGLTPMSKKMLAGGTKVNIIGKSKNGFSQVITKGGDSAFVATNRLEPIVKSETNTSNVLKSISPQGDFSIDDLDINALENISKKVKSKNAKEIDIIESNINQKILILDDEPDLFPNE